LMSHPQLAFVTSVPLDSAVTEGETVGAAVVNPAVEAALEAGSATSNVDQGLLAQLRSLEGPVLSPVSGVLGSEGDLPIVLSPGIDVVIGLTPIQDLRLQSLRFTGQAVVETIVGQQKVACQAMWRERLAPGETHDGTESASSELHCRLPRRVETVAGLRARVVVESELFEDAVVVPNVYVGYDEAANGYFIKVIKDGQESTLPVVVGVTNGVVRIITSDVPLGAILVRLGEE